MKIATVAVTVAVNVAIALAFASTVHADEKWVDYNKGIKWETSLDAAKVKAAREGKPILFHQLVGDLDKVGC